MHNLNLAFEVAEKHLDIPKMLDAEGECAQYRITAPCVCISYIIQSAVCVCSYCRMYTSNLSYSSGLLCKHDKHQIAYTYAVGMRR